MSLSITVKKQFCIMQLHHQFSVKYAKVKIFFKEASVLCKQWIVKVSLSYSDILNSLSERRSGWSVKKGWFILSASCFTLPGLTLDSGESVLKSLFKGYCQDKSGMTTTAVFVYSNVAQVAICYIPTSRWDLGFPRGKRFWFEMEFILESQETLCNVNVTRNTKLL